MKVLENEVTEFIANFLYHQQDDYVASILLKQFRSGYCYHFACILKDTFHRGQVCWAAPFGHIVWKDIDGEIYDIEGAYTGEAFHFIPIEYLGETIRDFLHNRTDEHPGATRSQLIDIMKKYCKDNNIQYIEAVEGYLK